MDEPSATSNSNNSTATPSSHGSNARPFKPVPLEFAVPFTITSGSLCSFGGVSNFFAIVVLLKYTPMRHNTDLYILSLCLSDFLYNILYRPLLIWRQFAQSRSTSFVNAFLHASSTLFLLAGCLSLFFVSLDKYLFIKYPFRYGLYINKTKTKMTVACIWAVSCVFGVFRYFKITGISSDLSAIIAAICFLCTIIVHVLIFILAKNQEKRIRGLNRSLQHNYPAVNETHETGKARSPHAGIIPTKSTKTISLMLAVYICSWLPSTIYRLHYRIAGGDVAVYHKWLKVLIMLIQLHSCANPYIYLFRTSDAKMAIKGLLRSYGIQRFWCIVAGRNDSSDSPAPGPQSTSKTQ